MFKAEERAISTGRSSYLLTCGSIKHRLSQVWQIVAADCTSALVLVGSWHTQGGLLLPPPRPDYIYLLALILSQSSRDKLYIVRVPGQTHTHYLFYARISCRPQNKPIKCQRGSSLQICSQSWSRAFLFNSMPLVIVTVLGESSTFYLPLFSFISFPLCLIQERV